MDKTSKILSILFYLILITYSQDTTAKQEENFDPLTLNEPFLPVVNGTMIREIFTELNPEENANKDSLQYVKQMGWKVQVVSIKDGVRADSILKKVSNVFGKENAQLIWNPPYWKIRVGNCATHLEAKQLLAKVKKMGYDRAWIIRSEIRLRKKQLPYY